MKLFTEVTNSTEDDAKYLVIEYDERDTKGFFLFVHHMLEEPSIADFWFPSLSNAKLQAQVNYGIGFDAWDILK